MKPFVTWVLGVAATIFVAVGLLQLARNSAESAWREHPEQLIDEQERMRTAELNEQRVAAHRRILAKSAVIEALAEGKIDLLEAARRCRDLTTPDAIVMSTLRRQFPNMPDDELFCRHVIALVESLLEEDPARTEAVVCRLNDELCCYLCNGLLRLEE